MFSFIFCGLVILAGLGGTGVLFALIVFALDELLMMMERI